MRTIPMKRFSIVLGLLAVFLLTVAVRSEAVVDGISGSTFNFTAKTGHILTADGNSVFMWLIQDDTYGTPEQYPAPTLILNQGDSITINLTNQLPVPTSLVFPGQDVTASGGSQGVITREAAPRGGTVSYTFTAANPGTYTYYSGTNPTLQVEMGLVGAIIVRPSGFDEATNRTAYGVPDSAYDHEYLFLLTDMDPGIHKLVEEGKTAQADLPAYFPNNWFINGRNGPDTMDLANVGYLPHQPYNCMPRMHPGDRVLTRVVGGGRDSHPLHTHGNHVINIAKDGRLLTTDNPVTPASVADRAYFTFTFTSSPGETIDGIFTWTGFMLGWDIYGDPAVNPHTCDSAIDGTYDSVTYEYCPDHGKPLPTVMPYVEDLFYGPMFSGSPFMGNMGFIPPGEGGFNPNAGYMYMWHSHNEKEIVNNNVFPGGMLTMMLIEPPGVPIP